MHPVNGYLLCARNWQEHGSLKPYSKEPYLHLSLVPFSSQAGASIEKEAVTAFHESLRKESRRVERLAVTMTVGYYKQVKSLLFLSFIPPAAVQTTKRGPP